MIDYYQRLWLSYVIRNAIKVYICTYLNLDHFAVIFIFIIIIVKPSIKLNKLFYYSKMKVAEISFGILNLSRLISTLYGYMNSSFKKLDPVTIHRSTLGITAIITRYLCDDWYVTLRHYSNLNQLTFSCYRFVSDRRLYVPTTQNRHAGFTPLSSHRNSAWILVRLYLYQISKKTASPALFYIGSHDWICKPFCNYLKFSSIVNTEKE